MEGGSVPEVSHQLASLDRRGLDDDRFEQPVRRLKALLQLGVHANRDSDGDPDDVPVDRLLEQSRNFGLAELEASGDLGLLQARL